MTKTHEVNVISWTVTFLSTRCGQLTIPEQRGCARTRFPQPQGISAAIAESIERGNDGVG